MYRVFTPNETGTKLPIY